jgi:hypothetical protein
MLNSTFDSRHGFYWTTTTLPKPVQGGIYKCPRRAYRLGWVRNTPCGGQIAYPHGWPAMEFGLHRPSSCDSPLPPLRERHHEANPWGAARWGQPARGFGQPATPWAHWSAAFTHYLLMSGIPPGWHLFWWNFKFPCNFLKCSNLSPMFLKSNKH